MLLESLKTDYNIIAEDTDVIFEDYTGMMETMLEAEQCWHGIMVEQIKVELLDEAADEAKEDKGPNFFDKIIAWFKEMISKISNFLRSVFIKITTNTKTIVANTAKYVKIISGNKLKNDKKDRLQGKLIDRDAANAICVELEAAGKKVEAAFDKVDDAADTAISGAVKRISEIKVVPITIMGKNALSIAKKISADDVSLNSYKGLFEKSIANLKAGSTLGERLKAKKEKNPEYIAQLNAMKKNASTLNLVSSKLVNIRVRTIKEQYNIVRRAASLYKGGTDEKDTTDEKK